MYIYQTQTVYYSEIYATKQRYELYKSIAKKIDDPQQYTLATSYGATAHINNISFNKGMGESVGDKNLSLNLTKIEKGKV
ncbi:MAG: hypothetical protein ACK5LL_12565 [Suipraeoptans sp.]